MLSPKGWMGIVFFLVPVFLAWPALAKDRAVESQWTAMPIMVDGLAEEWGEGTFLTEEGAGADLTFRNDADNLYLLLIIKDKTHLSSFDLTGISIFFSGEGKKNKDRRLHFYKKIASAEEAIKAMENSGQTLTEERRAELLSRKNYVLYQAEWIAGKEADPIPVVPSAQILLPMFKARTEGEKTVLEFRLPLSQESQAWGLGISPGGSLKLGLAWGGLTEQMKAQRLARQWDATQRAGMPPESQPSDDSTRGPQTHTDISSEMRKAPPKVFSFWLDIKLAKAERP